MKKALWKSVLPLAAGFMLFAGCVSEPPIATVNNPNVPPQPERQAEAIPQQPNMTFVWTQGFWDWEGSWVWVHGFWGPRPHPGAVWIRGGWVKDGEQFLWIHPHWR
jgi:hypothetical protein